MLRSPSSFLTITTKISPIRLSFQGKTANFRSLFSTPTKRKKSRIPSNLLIFTTILYIKVPKTLKTKLLNMTPITCLATCFVKLSAILPKTSIKFWIFAKKTPISPKKPTKARLTWDWTKTTDSSRQNRSSIDCLTAKPLLTRTNKTKLSNFPSNPKPNLLCKKNSLKKKASPS